MQCKAQSILKSQRRCHGGSASVKHLFGRVRRHDGAWRKELISSCIPHHSLVSVFSNVCVTMSRFFSFLFFFLFFGYQPFPRASIKPMCTRQICSAIIGRETACRKRLLLQPQNAAALAPRIVRITKCNQLSCFNCLQQQCAKRCISRQAKRALRLPRLTNP